MFTPQHKRVDFHKTNTRESVATCLTSSSSSSSSSPVSTLPLLQTRLNHDQRFDIKNERSPSDEELDLDRLANHCRFSNPSEPDRPVGDDIELHSLHDSLTSSLASDNGMDEPSIHTMPAGNLNKEATTSLSSLICLNLLEQTDDGFGPRDIVRATLLRHVKVQFALRNIFVHTDSVSSCSGSDSEASDAFSVEFDDDNDSDASRLSSDSDSMDSQQSSSSSCSDDDWESGSSSSGSSSSSSAMEPPRNVHVVMSKQSQESSPNNLRFALDTETRIEHCLVRSDFSGAIQIYQRELQRRHCHHYSHRAETLTKLGVLYMLVPFTKKTSREAMRCSMEAYDLYRRNDRVLQTVLSGMQVGLVHFWKSQPSKALSRWKKAMQTTCGSMGFDHPYVSILLNNIGILHYENGDFGASQRALAESLELQRSSLACIASSNVEHEIHQLACTMGNMAVVYDDGKRQFERAAALLQEALALYGSVATFPEDIMEETVTEYLENLTNLEQQHTKSKQLSESVSTSTSISTASCSLSTPVSLDSVSTAASHDAANFAENRGMLELGLLSQNLSPRDIVHVCTSSWFRQWGEGCAPDSDNTSHSLELRSICRLVATSTDRTEAVGKLAKFVKRQSKALGPKHPMIGTALHALGMTYICARDYDQAQTFLGKAVSLRAASLGPSHYETTESMMAMALVPAATGKTSNAHKILQSIKAGFDRPPITSKLLLSLLNNLGVLEYYQGDWQSAVQRLSTALGSERDYHADDEKKEDDANCDTTKRMASAVLWSNLGFVYARHKEPGKAMDCLQHALDIYSRHIGNENECYMLRSNMEWIVAHDSSASVWEGNHQMTDWFACSGGGPSAVL